MRARTAVVLAPAAFLAGACVEYASPASGVTIGGLLCAFVGLVGAARVVGR